MKSKTGSHPETLWLVKLYLFWEEGSCSMIAMSSQKKLLQENFWYH